MGAQRGWTVWRGKHLIRSQIWNQVDEIGMAHRARFPALLETGSDEDVLITLLAVMAEDLAEEGPTVGELGFLLERALGREMSLGRIAEALGDCGNQVWRMDMGREGYYVLEPTGRDRAAALASEVPATEVSASVWQPAPHLRVRLAS